jgi:hypothetical protein
VVQAAHAVSAVDTYVHGFVLQEVNSTFGEESQLAAMTGAIMEPLPASAYRALTCLRAPRTGRAACLRLTQPELRSFSEDPLGCPVPRIVCGEYVGVGS